MNKKILIGASIVVLIMILVGGYLFFFKKTSTTAQNPNTSPFGNPGNGAVVPETQNTNQQSVIGDVNTTIETKQHGLRQISTTPVSDASFLAQMATSSAPVVRFIERGSGHLFDADLTANSVVRVTNTTIPRIAQVSWGSVGKTFLAEYIDQNILKDTIIEIGTSTATSTGNGNGENFLLVNQITLPPNIISSSFSPKGDLLFYLLQGVSGVEGFVTNNRGEKPNLVWQFPTTEWITQWVATSTISLTTKPSNGIPGLMYLFDIKNKTSQIALSDVSGLLTNTSPLGDKILYTEISGKTWNTFVQDLKYKVRLPFPFSTLPEKCVWSKNELTIYCAKPRAVSAHAPDDWYQGKVSFDDTLWKFDFTTGEADQISEFTPAVDESIDLINPHLSANEDYIVFMNKKDLSLWATPTSAQ